MSDAAQAKSVAKIVIAGHSAAAKRKIGRQSQQAGDANKIRVKSRPKPMNSESLIIYRLNVVQYFFYVIPNNEYS